MSGAGLLVLLGTLTCISTAIGRRLLWQMQAEWTDAERIRFLGRHDPLTGLPNRYYFQDLFETERSNTLAQKGMLALHVLDVVDFKAINRT